MLWLAVALGVTHTKEARVADGWTDSCCDFDSFDIQGRNSIIRHIVNPAQTSPFQSV